MNTKLKIKKGDHVVVVSGKDKGKQGPVFRVIPREAKVVIEGVAMVKRHTRGVQGQSGRIVERPRAIHISNVMLLDPKDKKPTRVKRIRTDGKLVRTSVKSGTALS